MTFGPHLMLDMRLCDRQAIQDLNVVFDFLSKLPGEVGMTVIDPPKVMKYSGLVPEDWGVTGSVILAESHCTFHSFVDQEGFVFIDIFSCKEFDVEKAAEFIQFYFRPEELRMKVVKRGLDFPRNRGMISSSSV